jgi:hypothetical protein
MSAYTRSFFHDPNSDMHNGSSGKNSERNKITKNDLSKRRNLVLSNETQQTNSFFRKTNVVINPAITFYQNYNLLFDISPESSSPLGRPAGGGQLGLAAVPFFIVYQAHFLDIGPEGEEALSAHYMNIHSVRMYVPPPPPLPDFSLQPEKTSICNEMRGLRPLWGQFPISTLLSSLLLRWGIGNR